MPFSHITGNDRIKGYLTRILEKGMVGHAFLFAGPAGEAKRQFAHAFAKEILCEKDPEGKHRHKIGSGNHPDLHHLRPEGKIGLHAIDSLRQFSQEVYLPPNETSRKVFIIEEADRMHRYSANALLKTFEEPPLDTVIILVSDQPAALLPTVRSRCCEIHVQGNAEKEESDGERRILALLAAGGGTPGYAEIKRIAEEVGKEIEEERERVVKEARERLLANAKEQLTAVQVGEIEKEIEGMGSAYLRDQMKRIIVAILHWYRDLLLIKCDGDRHLLLLQGHKPQLEKLSTQRVRPLEELQKLTDHTLTAIDRSTPVPLCLENLLLGVSG